MMVKQGEMKEKRLTLECVQAVKNYIVACELQREDYFVGAADKWGNHTSRQIHEDSYAQSIHNWLGFAPYTFRKNADYRDVSKRRRYSNHRQTIWP